MQGKHIKSSVLCCALAPCSGSFHTDLWLFLHIKEIGPLSHVLQIFSPFLGLEQLSRDGARQVEYNSVGSGCSCTSEDYSSHFSSRHGWIVSFSFIVTQQWRSNWRARKRVHWRVSMETVPPTAFTIQRLSTGTHVQQISKERFPDSQL